MQREATAEVQRITRTCFQDKEEHHQQQLGDQHVFQEPLRHREDSAQQRHDLATVPKRIPAAEIVARVESNISKLTPEDRESLRKDIGTVLEQAKPPKSNITKDMEAALKSLKEDSTIMILPADKGRAAVILDTTTYRDKMDNLLSTGPYREIKKDPTDSLVRKLTTLLSGLKKKGSLEENTYQKLRPKRKQPPRIYGLPKIHKPAVPLRPIVSCIGSFAYELSKFLANILTPLTGDSPHTVRNSTDFADFVATQSIEDDDAMISFDVESLFTNVPIEGACRVARERLTADNQLASRTSLTPEEISSLLEFVLKSTYFLYNGKFYEQTEGAAMGSPVSAVIANMYMEAFENTALNDCPPKLEPKIWKRYVDDTFIIVNKHRSKDLLDFMNRRETTIRFTAEHETNGSLAFLDTEVHRQTDGTLKTTVYRKPTHTDQYLRYDSHHPHAVKRGLIKCLYDRANRIVTQPSDLSPEQRHLQSALTLNGYPKAFIKKSRKPKKRIILEEKQFTSTIVLPYVSTIAHQLRTATGETQHPHCLQIGHHS
nr:uncharacterized protein LOC129267568 [Lytechinus pictus]